MVLFWAKAELELIYFRENKVPLFFFSQFKYDPKIVDFKKFFLKNLGKFNRIKWEKEINQVFIEVIPG